MADCSSCPSSCKGSTSCTKENTKHPHDHAVKSSPYQLAMFLGTLVAILTVFSLYSYLSRGDFDKNNPVDVAEKIQQVSGNIGKVEFKEKASGGFIYTAFYDFVSVSSPLISTSNNLFKVSQRLVEQDILQENDEIQYLVYVMQADRLGNEHPSVAFRFEWNYNTLQNLDWAKMNNWKFMDSVDKTYIDPVMYKAFIRFVKEEGAQEQSSRFIEKAIQENNF